MMTQKSSPRRPASEEARIAIEQAEQDGVDRKVMTLRMTLRDVSELKRDPKVATADISYGPDGMTYLGVAVEQGGVTQSTLDRGDTSFRRGALAEAAAAPKPKAVRKRAAPKATAAKKATAKPAVEPETAD
jgi:hypothetical protein